MPTLYVETSIISYLRQQPSVRVITDEIMVRAILPPKAVFDALHIAIAAHHRIDYLLTWNCRHIANGRILSRVHAVLHDLAIPIPVICTPEELVEDDEPE